MIEEKISDLNSLLHNNDTSLTSILNAAIQIATLQDDSDNRLLFEYHLQGLDPALSSTFKMTSPRAYSMFFADRKMKTGSMSLTGSLSSLEADQKNADRDIEAAMEEVKRVRAAQPMPTTIISAASVGAANAVLGNYRRGRDQTYEVLSRIRLRVASYLREVENATIRPISARAPRSFSVSETDLQKIFLVHGQDDGTKQTVARFLEKVGLIPIILHEQANQGRTLIEKFEHHSDVGFAVVLLTPDDIGGSKLNPNERNGRARQNVVLELGSFTDGFLAPEFAQWLLPESRSLPI